MQKKTMPKYYLFPFDFYFSFLPPIFVCLTCKLHSYDHRT